MMKLIETHERYKHLDKMLSETQGDTVFIAQIARDLWLAVKDAVQQSSQTIRADPNRPRCPVCGTTNHTIDQGGFVITNPPRK
jgi:hypothetical protein